MGPGRAQRAYLGTRKGLFQFDVDAAGAWQLALVQFAGDPVSMLLHDEGLRLPDAGSARYSHHVRPWRNW